VALESNSKGNYALEKTRHYAKRNPEHTKRVIHRLVLKEARISVMCSVDSLTAEIFLSMAKEQRGSHMFEVTISACCSAIRPEKTYSTTLEEQGMGPSAPRNLTAFVFSEDASQLDATTNLSREST